MATTPKTTKAKKTESQGDIQKLKHIIKGVLNEKLDDNSTGIVFYYFGRHLSNPRQEPIVDQHVIRSWKHYKNIAPIELLSSFKTITKADLIIIEGYIKWFKEFIISKGSDFIYYADRLLFLHGKGLKNNVIVYTI